MKFHGFLEYCYQSHIRGWAANETLEPVPVTVAVGDAPAIVVPPNLPRPDLEARGRALMSGFMYIFPEPLAPDDRVVVTLPDGTHLAGSPSTGHRARLRELLDGIDLSVPGLELGPLDRPILSKSRSKVLYVDHASREDLRRKYAAADDGGSVDLDRIRDVDIVWRGGALRALLPTGSPIGWCIASHVIEHTPDMIGWLRAITDALAPGGMINLAVPDKERTFDWRRSPTDLSALIATHLEGRATPSPAQVFDHIALASDLGDDRPLALQEALQRARKVARDPDYVDVHCSVFTQHSFLLAMASIAELGLVDLALRRFFPTRPGTNEFVVSLVKSGHDADANAATFREAAATMVVPAPQPARDAASAPIVAPAIGEPAQFREFTDPGQPLTRADCYFYHSFDLPGFGHVEGDWDLRGRETACLGGYDFKGKTVFDCGIASGFLAFEMERRGATVIGLDLDEDAERTMGLVPLSDYPGRFGQSMDSMIHHRRQAQKALRNSFLLARRVHKSSVRLMVGNIMTSAVPEEADVALFGNILLHLRDPLAALHNIAPKVRDAIIVCEILVEPVLTLEAPPALLLASFGPQASPVTWWWISPSWLYRVLGSIGFTDIRAEEHKLTHNVDQNEVRAYTLVARRR